MNPQQIAQLSDLLSQEKALMEALHTVLEQEFEALAQRNGANLDAAAKEKQRLVAQLEAATAVRNDFLQGAGLAADWRDIETALANLDAEVEQALGEQWLELRGLLEACEMRNQRNGQLIDGVRQYTEEALSILLGQRGSGETYTRGGKTAGLRENRSYAKV